MGSLLHFFIFIDILFFEIKKGGTDSWLCVWKKLIKILGMEIKLLDGSIMCEVHHIENNRLWNQPLKNTSIWLSKITYVVEKQYFIIPGIGIKLDRFIICAGYHIGHIRSHSLWKQPFWSVSFRLSKNTIWPLWPMWLKNSTMLFPVWASNFFDGK